MDQKKKVGGLIIMNSQPRIFHIFDEGKVTVGKDSLNTITIDDIRIASFHCSIFFQDGQVVLKNLCQQGTFLNKEKMGLNLEVNLEHMDYIYLCKQGNERYVVTCMFIKYENKKQSARKSSKRRQPLLEQIRDDLICIICQDLYYEGVAVSPCGHVFCGYCLQGWENENNTCPICRVQMRNITKAFQINKIINTFLQLNPEVEQKEKPANKYFLYEAENESAIKIEFSDDSDSDIDIDSDSESQSDSNMFIQESDPEPENEVLRRIQGDLLLLRQQSDLQISELSEINNQLQQLRQSNQQTRNFNQEQRLREIEQILQTQWLVEPQNIQQNAQNERQNAQQNQQNILVQNAQANQQRANSQPNPQPPQRRQQRQ